MESEAPPEGGTTSDGVIHSYTDENGQTYYPNLNVSPTASTFTFTPGYYEVEFEGDPEGLRFSTSATVNLSAGDQTIDISDYILVYEFNVEDAADTWYNGQVCYRQADDKYWSSYRLDSSQNTETGRLTCTTTYPRLVEEINESDEAYLIIYSDTALYIMTIKGSSSEYPTIDPSQGATTLDPSTLNKVSLVCDPDAWQIQSVDVGWNDFSFDMYGETLYLPDGTYNFSTVLESENRILINKVDATVSEDCEIKVDQNLENFRDVMITWPTSFNATGSVYCETADGKNVRAGNFLSGSNFKTTDGMNEFTFELKQNDARFVIARDYEVSESAHEITIGDNFTGALEGYYPDEQAQGAEISVSLSDLIDQYGNRLTSLSAFDSPLQGNIVFTDVTDPSRSFTSPVTVQDLYGFKVVLPDEGGIYALTLELSTNGSEAEKPTYTVTFDSQGGSDVASQTVLEGDKVTEPIEPTRTGYTFTGWYTTAECTTKWDFSQAITGNMTLYAGWTASEEPEGPDEPGGTDTPDTPGGTDTPVNPPTGTDHPTYEPEISESENGTIDVYPQKPEAGEEVIITPTPDEGYEVSDVIVTDENGEEIEVTKNDDGSYSYEQPDGEVVIEVVFEEISDTPGTAVEEIFTDIPSDAWYGEAVQYVYDLGLMTGTSDTTFEPATPTTRGMLVAILHRLEGGPDAESGDFSDVADNDWYGLAVSWAAENGIVGGYEDGTFQPNKYITREEMASILYRYCQYKGIDVTVRADLSHYDDAPSDWALEVMQWANAEGLINGRTATTINAQDDTIRAEMAAILQRYIENVL